MNLTEITAVVFSSLVTVGWAISLAILCVVLAAQGVSRPSGAGYRLTWILALSVPGVLALFGSWLPGWFRNPLQWDLPGGESLWLPLASIYLVGVTIGLARLVYGWWKIRQWTAASRIVTDARIVEPFEVAKAAHGVRTPCYLLIGAGVPSPITVGIVNHRVLLPEGLISELSDEELRDLALHEVAHIRRGDPLVFAFAAVARALFWPNPLVWLATHQLRLQAERAADGAVVEVTEEVKPYTNLLVKMASRTPQANGLSLAAGLNFHKSAFLQRAESLLATALVGPSRGRSDSLLLGAGLTCGTAIALACPLEIEVPGAPDKDPAYTVAPDGYPADANESEEPWMHHDHEAHWEEKYAADHEHWLEKKHPHQKTLINVLDDAVNRGSEPQGAVAALGIQWPIERVAFDHWYGEHHGHPKQKMSWFTFRDPSGRVFTLALDRGQLPATGDACGDWHFSDGRFERELLTPLVPGSPEDLAAVAALASWIVERHDPRKVAGWFQYWPEFNEYTEDYAVLMVAESLESMLEIRYWQQFD